MRKGRNEITREIGVRSCKNCGSEKGYLKWGKRKEKERTGIILTLADEGSTACPPTGLENKERLRQLTAHK